MQTFLAALINFIVRVFCLFLIELGVIWLVHSTGGFMPTNGWAVFASGINLLLVLMVIRAIWFFFKELFHNNA